MLKITTLGLALAAFVLSGAMPAASAEDVPVDEITCSDGPVQIASPSGMSVCVFEQSVPGLESMGFGFTGGTFDMFPIKMPTGFDGSAFIPPGYSSPPGFSSPPVISMSHLPEIGETAMVNITYTNDLGVNVTTTENQPTEGIFKVGWLVSSGFEVVDDGGNEPWAINGSSKEPARLGYSAFVPLDAGESFTYIIEVRAVEAKLSYIGATGYFFSNSRLNVWLDYWETLTHQDREERVGQIVFALIVFIPVVIIAWMLIAARRRDRRLQKNGGGRQAEAGAPP